MANYVNLFGKRKRRSAECRPSFIRFDIYRVGVLADRIEILNQCIEGRRPREPY